VNGSIDLETAHIFNEYNTFSNACDKEINSMFTEFEMLHEKVTLESEIMGTVPESMMMVYEDGKKNIFTTIGEMIIKLYNSIKNAIDGVVDWVKNITFKNKTDVQKAQMLMKKFPDLKDEIWGSFKSGALDLSDLKNMREMEDAFDDILKMYKKNADPKSIAAKIEKAKKKFENAADAAHKSTTIINAAKAIVLFVPACAGAIHEMKKYKDERKKSMEENIKLFKDQTKSGDVPEDAQHGARLMLQFRRYIDGKYSAMMKDTTNVFAKLSNRLADFVDKHFKKLSNDMYQNYKGVDDKVTSKDKQEKDAKNEEKEADRKARATEKEEERKAREAEKEADRKARREDAYMIGFEQQRGRNAAEGVK
jgi:hypothetical protein